MACGGAILAVVRVAIMTAGSRGDVAPYTGLGHGLSRAGHEVTLVTHARFEPLVAGSKVHFHALPVDPRAELESSRGRGLHGSGTGVGKLVRVVAMARTLVGRMTDDLVAAARSSDVLLLSGSVGPLGHTIAEGLSLPYLDVPLQPLAPTREFGPPMLGVRSLGAVGNRIAGHGVGLAVEQVFAGALPAVRERLGLPRASAAVARRARERPVLHGFSPWWYRGRETGGRVSPLPDTGGRTTRFPNSRPFCGTSSTRDHLPCTSAWAAPPCPTPSGSAAPSCARCAGPGCGE